MFRPDFRFPSPKVISSTTAVRPDHTAWVARGEYAFGDVSGDDAARADNTPGADADARTDDRAPADPHVRPDLDRLAEFPLSTHLGVERVEGGVNLHAGPNSVKSPMRTAHSSRTTQLKLKKTRLPRRMLEP